MIDHNECLFCADLIERFIMHAAQFDALRPDESEMLETAAHELRTWPKDLSLVTAGVTCGVIQSYLKRSAQAGLTADDTRMMHSIKRRLRDSAKTPVLH